MTHSINSAQPLKPLSPIAQALVYAFRRSARPDSLAAATYPELQRLLGEEEMRPLLAAIEELVSCWICGYSHLPLINDLNDEAITLDERALLQLIDAWQGGDEVAASGIVQWLVLGPWRSALLKQSALIAGQLRQRGHPLALGKAPLFDRQRRCQRGAQRPQNDLLTTLHQLSSQESIVLNALRLWHSRRAVPEQAQQGVDDYFTRLGFKPVGASFHRLLLHLDLLCEVKPTISCTVCPQLSRDETSLLIALAAYQHGEVALAANLFGHWFSPLQRNLALATLCQVIQQLNFVRLELPRRQRLWQSWLASHCSSLTK